MSRDPVESNDALSMRVARVLMVGGALSIILLAIGVATLIMFPHTKTGSTLPLSDLPFALLRGRSSALLTLGILVMIVTPIARVFVLVLGFVSSKDRAFILISSTVLAVLLLSMTLAY